MHGGRKSGDEAGIKELLVSRRSSARIAGLERLDEAYRESISGYVRSWSDRHGFGLTADNIADVWRETVKAVAVNVENGAFKFAGRLDAYLRLIARRKAIDLLRRRVVNGLDGDQLAGPEQPQALSEFYEELELCYNRLSENLRLVLRIDVSLFFAAGGKSVSLKDLTDEINRLCGLSLPESTVKSRRARAHKELARLLNQRGYGG